MLPCGPRRRLWETSAAPEPSRVRTQKNPEVGTCVPASGFSLVTATVVELGGIEPPSNAESPRLLRAQSVQTFYSAPTFVTDT